MKFRIEKEDLSKVMSLGYIGQVKHFTRTANLEVTVNESGLEIEYSPNNVWWRRYGQTLSIHRLLVINGLRLKKCTMEQVKVTRSKLTVGFCRLYLRYCDLVDTSYLNSMFPNLTLVHHDLKDVSVLYAGPLSYSLLQLLVNLLRSHALEISGEAALSLESCVQADWETWKKVSGSWLEDDVLETLQQEDVYINKNIVTGPSFLLWDRESVMDSWWSHWLRDGRMSFVEPLPLRADYRLFDWLRYNGYQVVEHPRLADLNKFNSTYYRPLFNVELGYPIKLDLTWLASLTRVKIFTFFQTCEGEHLLTMALRFRRKNVEDACVQLKSDISNMFWECLGTKLTWNGLSFVLQGQRCTLQVEGTYLHSTVRLNELSLEKLYEYEVNK